jgi:hypothetical protein
MRPLVGAMLAGAALAEGTHALAQPADAPIRSHTVVNAPSGSVGRKTTDTETTIGTDGNSTTMVLTIGGFARQCPRSDGKVAGEFEYALTSDEVIVEDGVTRRTHYAHRIAVALEAHVLDDARLDTIDAHGQITHERDGAPRTTQAFDTTFRPGEGGQPDTATLRRLVETTADVASAGALWFAGPLLKEAELIWNRPGCTELELDPPTETRALGPNQSADVRVQLKAKEDGGIVKNGGEFRANGIEGIGTVAPLSGSIPADGPWRITYTAAARPRKGNGFDIGVKSRAGVGEGHWKIAEPELDLEFELTLTQAGEDINGNIHLVLPATKLVAEQDGAYRGSGDVATTGSWRAVGCTADTNFSSTIRIAAHPDPADRTRLQLEFTPNQPQHPVTMRCPDIDFAQTVPMPFHAWIDGPTKNPAVLGVAVPVQTVVTFDGGFRATLDGSVKISVPPAERR